MWRAFFMAIGISLALIGVECLVLERAVLHDHEAQASASSFMPSSGGRTIEPPEWAPWSFLSAGTVITLYSMFLKSGGG